MKKTNDIAKMLVSELIPKKIVDENAQTIAEIATVSKISATSAKCNVKHLLDDKKIEKVWKQNGRNLVPAYRVI